MTLCNHHQELDASGRGKCSVPMWRMGLPAGFCDAEAYGECPLQTQKQRDFYIPALACPTHGGPASRVFKDGNKWCAVFSEFTNLQESKAGFGDTTEEARRELEDK